MHRLRAREFEFPFSVGCMHPTTKGRVPKGGTLPPQERIRLPAFVFRQFRGVTLVSWDRPFDQPLPLPGERPARTLRDAGNYIRELPQSERDTPEWRLAVQMLIDAAEDRGPLLFAKMGMVRAINRMAGRAFNPNPKTGQPSRTGWTARRKLPSAR
jgi:hypothetical protein